MITYHVKNCQRIGGFHYFIKYLEKLSYDVDWVTCTVSLSWIFRKNDRDNLGNFIDLWKGITFEENNVTVRHFSAPVFIPAKIAKIFGMKLGYHYWPSWRKLRKRMKSKYDVILVEGVGCQYAAEIKKDYPDAKIIYRPSDILETFSEVKDAQILEARMIETADVTLCVDENQLKYYLKFVDKKEKLDILRNPLSTKEDILFLKNIKPHESLKKSLVYVGTSFLDIELIEYAALKNQDADFIIIGPFNKKSHDNVKYLGTLNKEQYVSYLEQANVGINPLAINNNIMPYGYTRKIISYMTYLLPVVTTNSANYLNVDGFFVAKNKDEFSDYIKETLAYSIDERLSLKKGYMRVMEEFLEENVEQKFKTILEKDNKLN